jgi:hypothetical protein
MRHCHRHLLIPMLLLPLVATAESIACTTVIVTVISTWLTHGVPPVTGEQVALVYPRELVELPGSGSDETVQSRVVLLLDAPSGLFGVADIEAEAPAAPQINAVLASTNPISQGPFVEATFDCKAGARDAIADDFTCTVLTTTAQGGAGGTPTCSLGLWVN